MLVAGEVTEKVTQKKRGRPRKFPDQPPKPKVEAPKRGRGRPKKDPKGRGRPKKKVEESDGEPESSSPKKMKTLASDDEGLEWAVAGEDKSDEASKKKGRGRPKKEGTSVASTEVDDMPKRKRGRPKNPSTAAQAPVDNAVKKRRVRPTKNPLASPSKMGSDEEPESDGKVITKFQAYSDSESDAGPVCSHTSSCVED